MCNCNWKFHFLFCVKTLLVWKFIAHDPAHNLVSRIAIQNFSNAESVAWFYLLVILLFITRLRVQNRDSEENYSNNSYRPVLWRVFFPIKNKIYIKFPLFIKYILKLHEHASCKKVLDFGLHYCRRVFYHFKGFKKLFKKFPQLMIRFF